MPSPFPLRRMNQEPPTKQYYYLSLEDSIRYDEVKDSDDPRDQEIAALILDKARASHAAHCASRY